MRKKDLFLYAVILVLTALFLWQWLSKGALIQQLHEMQMDNNDLHLLSGIGNLRSTHKHADVKVYINGNSIDFSQRKYQLASRFIHFEEGIGDVVHVHATGLTIGHLLKSLKGSLNNNCLVLDGNNYCSDNSGKLRFYVNNKPNSDFGSYVFKDLDKMLISYGDEDDSVIQKQLDSVTNLAARYSAEG
ncbi:hypothetical protein HYT53_06130 [Candidatus Woesearchaeota archaeon]|nr:hypothetical protein [Candidatus Woesearchaeota archaeon]